MSEQFSRLARWSAQRPRQVQWGITALMFVTCVGFLGFHFEDRPEELWALEGSELVEALHYMRTIPSWDDGETRALIVIFESDATDGAGNVLTSSFMDAAAEMHEQLMGTRGADGTTSYYDVCKRLPDTLGQANGVMASAPCFVYSYLEFWPPRVPCMDVPEGLLTSQTESLGFPFNLFDGCRSLSAAPVRLAGINCDTALPLEMLGMAQAPSDGSLELVVGDICPATCNRCPNGTATAAIDITDPVVSSINPQRLLRDRRMFDVLNTTSGALNQLCADFPASLISSGSQGMVRDCADILGRSADISCSSNLSSAEVLAASESAAEGNPDCWDAEYTFERCCNGGRAGVGDASCWGAQHTYATCCTGGGVAKADAERLATYSPASFCPAHRNACPEPADAAAQDRAVPLVLLNGIGPVLQWDTATLLGRAGFDDASGALMEATSIRLIYTLECGGEKEEQCYALEDSWMQTLGAGSFLPWPFNRPPDQAKSLRGDARARFFSLKGQNQEMLRAMFGTAPLLGLSCILMTVYITLALGKVGQERRHSKIFVGMCGNCVVGIATVMTFGISCGMGVIVTPISQVVPFLLLGIGVDDMFVIVRTLERMPLSLSTEERIQRTFRECGGAIAVTSCTDALAFLVGATIKFPAMRAFCINAGIGVLLLFALQLTFMAAVLSLTDQALKGNPSKCGAFLIQARDRIEGPMAEPAMESGLNSGEEPPAPKSIVQGFMERNIAPFLLHASDGAHRALLGFFAALFLLGVIGATQMERGFPLTDVFCDDSYVSDFLRASSKHFPNQAYPFFIVFRGVDYDDAAQRIEMDRIKTEMEALPEVSEKVSNWVSAYERSVYFDATTFSAGLEGFLASPEGVQYGQDIVFADDGSVQASRFIGYLPGDMTADSPLRSAAQQEAMVEKLKTITHGSSLDCFSFSFVMLVWEVWTELIVQMFINLGQAFVAIGLCTSVFLLHPATAVIVTLNVAVVEIELAAFCALIGVQLNTVTVVIFIMNFGLVVDYSAHIAHHFMTTGGTPRERAARAINEMGSSVFNGAFSTALGMLPLVWAPFETGRVFLWLFAAIIFLGVLHAFVLLPVLLTVVAPPACSEKSHDSPGELQLLAVGEMSHDRSPSREAAAGPM